jgi:type IV secretion system protein VirB1
MILALPVLIALAHQCAPGVAPEAMLSIVTVESHGDPLAINVNRVGRLHAENPQDAVALATHWIAAGYSVDLGLAQINSHNLVPTGLSIEAAFDPCRNISAGAQILQENYSLASRGATGFDAISRTFSLYNTGNMSGGFANSYVARVWRAAEDVVPQIEAAGSLDPAISPVGSSKTGAPPTDPVRPSFVVGQAERSVLIFK